MEKIRKSVAFNMDSERDVIAYNALHKYAGKGMEFNTKIKLVNHLILNADRYQNDNIEPFITEIIYREIARRKRYDR